MRAVSASFRSALVQTHRRAARITPLAPDLSPIDISLEGVLLQGSVTIGTDRRRAVSLTIANPDGEWTPAGADDVFYPNRILLIERGVYVDGNPEFVALGVFVIDRPSVARGAAGVTLTVAGQDRLKLALGSRFTVPTRYQQGRPIGDLVSSIGRDAGMGSILYRLDDENKALRADRSFEVGESRMDALRGIATDYALDLYVDADGWLVLAPTLDLGALPEVAWRFRAGEDALMLGLTKDWNDDRLYNHVLVTGEASDLRPVSAEARDLNPTSPAYNPEDGSGPIGDRLYTYTSAMIRDAQQAQDVANALLPTVALLEETIELPSVVIPILESGDVISIVDEATRTSDLYLIDSLTIPLTSGAMSIQSRKLRTLTATGALVDYDPPPPPLTSPPPPSAQPAAAGVTGRATATGSGSVTLASPPAASPAILPLMLPASL